MQDFTESLQHWLKKVYVNYYHNGEFQVFKLAQEKDLLQFIQVTTDEYNCGYSTIRVIRSQN